MPQSHAIPKKPAGFSRRALGAALTSAMVLGGCGGGDGGGWGWLPSWGQPEEPSIEPEGGYKQAYGDPRPLAPKIDEMVVERVAGGVIVRVSGVMPSQDYWDADLIRPLGDNPVNGVFRLEFRAWPPIDAAEAPIGEARGRELTAGIFLSEAELTGVGRITVASLGNEVSRSR